MVGVKNLGCYCVVLTALAASPAGASQFKGVASFYTSADSGGQVTATGARYDERAMTAAHRTLPLGTKLKVTRGKRCAIVVVNDRGPFVRGRVLDLSKAAGHKLGLRYIGTGVVAAEVVAGYNAYCPEVAALIM